MLMIYDTGITEVVSVDKNNLNNVGNLYSTKSGEMVEELDSYLGQTLYNYTASDTETITITSENIGSASSVYSTAASSFEAELEAYLETLAIGRTITKNDLNAESIITAIADGNNITTGGNQVYFKIPCTISEHNQYNTRIQVTIGPSIQWSTDSNMATSTTVDIGNSYVINLNKDNINNAATLYAEKETILKNNTLEYFKSQFCIGQVILPEYLGASTIRSYVNGSKTVYYRPSYNIPAHTEYSESVTVTVGSSISYGDSNTSLHKSYNPGSSYEYTITITKNNVSTAPTTYGEKVALLQGKLDEYLDSLLGTTITSTMLGADTVRSYTIPNTTQVIYFKPRFNIPAHTADDESVTITVGSVIDYGTASGTLDNNYDAGSSHTYSIVITNAELNNLTTLYNQKVALLQTELESYVLTTTLGKVITATDLGAETVRTYQSTSANATVYYKTSYTIPEHVANNFSVTITVGPNVQYGYTNALGRTYNTNQTYTITITKDEIETCDDLYTEKVALLEAKLEEHIAAVRLGTVVTEQNSGASTTRTFYATTSNKNVYFKPEFTIPAHNANDEEITITVGSVIQYGYTSAMDKTYNAGSANTQSIVINRSNVANVATLYTQKADILKGLLDAYLTSIKLDKVVTQQDLGAEQVRTLTTTKAHETIYYKVQYAIAEHTANDTEVQVTLGPYIEWGYDADEV